MIEVEKLTKYYGDFPAIEDISFSVKKGEILGFLGPNAAGKTTAMRILTCFMPPSGARPHRGYDILDHSLEVRKHIGYLPEMVPLYTRHVGTLLLEFMGRIRGMDSKRLKKRRDDVIGLCRLEDYANTPIGRLSKGFRQRVGIGSGGYHEPDVLILDEPTVASTPARWSRPGN